MAVQQTECYRVVTIGYLKDFIGTLIQDSSNGSVKYVNLNALSEEKRRDDYCPTYSELTGGTIIQTWDEGEYSPNGDRDGITVNSSAILGGNYANNQCVDQRDLMLKYTRFSGLTISLGKTSFSACGDSTSVSYSHKYTRYTKSMNDSCVTDTSSAEASDTVCRELTWHPSIGTVSNCNTYTIGQNGTAFSAASRDISVYADISFRGTPIYSNTVNMVQLERGGDYLVPVSTRTTYTGITAYGVEPTTVGCDGGTCYARAEAYYDLYETLKWRDICGNVFDNERKESFVRSGSTDAGTGSHYFSKVECPTETAYDYYDIPFEYGGQSTSYRVYQDCSQSCGEPTPTCARGTDNGTDVIDGVSYTHPMLICAPAYTDSDSTYVQDIKYNGSQLSSSWVTVNSWLQIRRDTDGSGSVCGYGWIHYKVTKNDTGSIRSTTLRFSTTDSQVCTDSPVYQKYGIRNACPEWDVEVKQAPCGYYWCGDHSYTSVLVPCGSGCEYGSTGSTCDDACDCGSGPEPPTGTCTCSNLPVVNPASISVGSDGDNDKSIIYTVTNDCSVSISTDSSSWIHLTDRPSQSKVDVVIEGNQSTSSRSGNIFFEIDGDTCRTVPVSQEGASSGPYTYTVNFINNSSANGGVSFHLLLNDGTEITSGGASIGSSGGNWSTTLSTNTTIRSLSYFYGSGGGWSGSFDSSSYSVSGYGTKTLTVTITKWE